MSFRSVGKDGQELSAEQTFWACIDEAHHEWEWQASLQGDELKGMSAIQREGYLSARLINKLHNILLVSKHMPRPTGQQVSAQPTNEELTVSDADAESKG